MPDERKKLASELLDEVIKSRREVLQMDVLLLEQLRVGEGPELFDVGLWKAYRNAVTRLAKLVTRGEQALGELIEARTSDGANAGSR